MVVIDDGAPQYNPRTHYVMRVWVEEERDIEQPVIERNSVTGVVSARETFRTAVYTVVPVPISSEHVNAERDKRMETFAFGGTFYDLDAQSVVNVAGAGTLALGAISQGALPGNLRWADSDTDFTWIAADNSVVAMDAQTTWAFAQAAAGWRKKMIYSARALKDMAVIPADYADDRYWR